MIEAAKQFRRVNGHLHLLTLQRLSSLKSPKLPDPSCTLTR